MLRNSSLLSFCSNIDAMDNQDSLKLFTCEIGDCLATILDLRPLDLISALSRPENRFFPARRPLKRRFYQTLLASEVRAGDL